jgi:pimeloyl-ACP methyl ester carboxylesterase
MKVLLLHGFLGNSNLKKFMLEKEGIAVIRPRLSNLSFKRAVNQAQAAYDSCQPDIVVASSRGAAVALNLLVNQTPLVFLSPAWEHFVNVYRIDSPLTIIHGKRDRLIPIRSSLALAVKSANATVYVVDDSHRLVHAGTDKLLEVIRGFMTYPIRIAPSYYSFSR